MRVSSVSDANNKTRATPFAKSNMSIPTSVKKSGSWDQQSAATASTTEEFSVDADVPRSLWLSQSLRENVDKMPKIQLVPLNCTFGVVNQKPAMSMKSALKKERQALHKNDKKSDISIVFAVRHPGCVQVREHGLQLSELAASKDDLMRGVNFWGIVKESSGQEQSLLNFYDNYFHFPLYVDNKWSIYKAMGDRKLCIINAVKQAFRARSRWASKGLCNQFNGKGDARLQGGILIFKRGKLRFACDEVFGKELDLNDFRATIRALKDEDVTSSTEMSSSTESFVSTRIEI
ncbi:hypothetical protein MPSEU_000624400 [Mayamaea pseudoterrestris]|nr:hypothetical protein MPSEU_000624400 [Mayamaea pseudoterrestris]